MPAGIATSAEDEADKPENEKAHRSEPQHVRNEAKSKNQQHEHEQKQDQHCFRSFPTNYRSQCSEHASSAAKESPQRESAPYPSARASRQRIVARVV
jgi:ABC-type Zn2+ transport system substrate-binding protein/surface adhesin